ncbi:MAG: alpha-galactosidase, partial [Planctomycetota bacterium]
HVNPQLKRKGLAMVYNPLDRKISRQLKLPLYYTGLTRTAKISEQRGKSKKYRLDREYNVEIPISIAPHAVAWFVIE